MKNLTDVRRARLLALSTALLGALVLAIAHRDAELVPFAAAALIVGAATLYRLRPSNRTPKEHHVPDLSAYRAAREAHRGRPALAARGHARFRRAA